MKKIVYLIQHLYSSAGMERVLSVKANYLAEQGYDITIITTDQKGRNPYFALDSRIKLYDLAINYEENNGKSIWNKLFNYPIKQLSYRKQLTKLLQRLKVDIVISTFGQEASFLPKIKDGSKKLLEYHFSKLKRFDYGRKGLWHIIDNWRTHNEISIVKSYDKFVVLTKEDQALWGDLPNIISISNPLQKACSKMPNYNAKRVMAAGRLSYEKNFSELIHIWAKLTTKYPDWTLDIFGDGRQRETLQKQIEDLNLINVVKLHHSTSSIEDEYLKSSIFVMTSHYEGMPMVLLEAQGIGLPIVSYACQCGPRDIITDEVNGFLIKPQNQEDFVIRLSQLMDSLALRQTMGIEAKNNSKKFLIQEIMSNWESLFAEV